MQIGLKCGFLYITTNKSSSISNQLSKVRNLRDRFSFEVVSDDKKITKLDFRTLDNLSVE